MEEKNIKKPWTKRQKEFFKNLPHSKSATEAAKKSGYSDKTAKVIASQNLTKFNGYWDMMLAKAGCTDQHLAKGVREGTEANRVVGYLNNKIDGIEKVSDEFVEIPDWQARAKFHDIAFKLKGAFVEKTETTLKGEITTHESNRTLDQIISKLQPNEQKQFIENLAKCFGA